MIPVTNILEFRGARAFVPHLRGELEGVVTEVVPYRPGRRITLDVQIQMSKFRLELNNGQSVLVDGCYIVGIDRAYDEQAPVM